MHSIAYIYMLRYLGYGVQFITWVFTISKNHFVKSLHNSTISWELANYCIWYVYKHITFLIIISISILQYFTVCHPIFCAVFKSRFFCWFYQTLFIDYGNHIKTKDNSVFKKRSNNDVYNCIKQIMQWWNTI